MFVHCWKVTSKHLQNSFSSFKIKKYFNDEHEHYGTDCKVCRLCVGTKLKANKATLLQTRVCKKTGKYVFNKMLILETTNIK